MEKEEFAGMDLIQELLDLDDGEAQKRFLDANLERMDTAVLAKRLKEQADHFLRGSLQRSQEIIGLLYELFSRTGDPVPRALGLLAEANAHSIGMGEYEAALALYDQGAEIYREMGRTYDHASAQIGKIGALLALGRYTEGLQIARQAREVLMGFGAWYPLAKLTSNMAVIYYQMGDDRKALEMFTLAQRMYEQVEMGGGPGWLRVEYNRAIILRNLGEFDASIEASQKASRLLAELGQPIEAARARQSMALTYYITGRNNEALQILDEVRDAFLADGRTRDAVLVELFTTDCLLQLRRFESVLESCARIRRAFTELGTRFEVTLAIIDEALAYAGLKRYEEALASLEEARRRFEEQGNNTWTAHAELESAEVLLHRGDAVHALEIARRCLPLVQDQPLRRSQACLIIAGALLEAALLEDGSLDEAESFIYESMQSGDKIVPSLAYACHHLLARIARQRGQPGQALAEYEQAIRDLENWRSRMMVEFRAGFLEDKQSIYESAVELCVETGQAEQAFQFAERAKSQSLRDLLEYRINLRISALNPEDAQLTQELAHLREERDRLHRRWESNAREEMRVRGDIDGQHTLLALHQEVAGIEQKITELWHRLLVRNASYARESSLWQVQAEPIYPYLDHETLLVEYYSAHGILYAFLATCEGVSVQQMPGSMPQVQRLVELLWLNLRTVMRSPVDRRDILAGSARAILRKLYESLASPLEEALSQHKKVLFVPHGPLHYLPLHALYDGHRYLIQDHLISYLPSAGFLRFCRASSGMDGDMLVVGSSNNGALPQVLEEARAVARLWGSQPLLEEQATLERVRELAIGCRAVHIAAHGEFRPDNPLFSGLAFADGWLTTLDVFNWELAASLVVLSACDTGRSVVGGGDELLGLMRAFLYTGASTLVLSQWAVEDRAAALLMENFYRGLAGGLSKGEALRQAQLAFLEQPGEGGELDAYRHPYFWAPFMLVGHSGAF